MTERPVERAPFPLAVRGCGLRLRPWRTGDEAEVLRGLTDPGLLRWNTMLKPVRTEADALLFIRRRAELWESGDAAYFCVAEDAPVGAGAPGERVLGNIGLRLQAPPQSTAHVGYWVLPEARGRGVARRALDLCSRWAFGEQGVHRIELRHVVGHEASCRVAEHCGYRYEGTLREGTFAEGRHDAFRDAHLHARLASDPAPRW